MSNSNFSTFTLVLTFSIGLFGCRGTQGSGKIENVAREVGPFHAVALGGEFDCDITIDPKGTQAVALQGDDNLLPLISTHMNGGQLRISTMTAISPSKTIHVTIIAKELDALLVSGAGNVRVNGIRSPKWAASVSGAAQVTLAGQATESTIDISGAADVSAFDLLAQTATVRLSGAGNAQVFASAKLDVRVSGVGNVEFRGNPKIVDKNITGVGSVTAK